MRTQDVTFVVLWLLFQTAGGQQSRINIANDDHTDFMWTADVGAEQHPLGAVLTARVLFRDSGTEAGVFEMYVG